MKRSKGMQLGAMLAAMLLLSVALMPAVSAQNTKTQVEINGQGFVIQGSDKDPAKMQLTGSMDDSKNISVTGTITIGKESYDVALQGQAEEVFIGWDTSKLDKNNLQIVETKIAGNKTIRRYIGSEKMYAILVNLQNDQFSLQGEIFKAEKGWFHGYANINGVQSEIVLSGQSNSLARILKNKPIEKESGVYITASKDLSVPYRSQYESELLDHGWDVASRGCSIASLAMLEGFYEGNSPNLWDIWNWYGTEHTSPGPYSNAGKKQYLEEHTTSYFVAATYTGTLDANINYVKGKINNDWPTEIHIKGLSGVPHSVVIKGYDDSGDPAFKYHDPNNAVGPNKWLWYYDTPWYSTTASFKNDVYLWNGDGLSNGIKVVY